LKQVEKNQKKILRGFQKTIFILLINYQPDRAKPIFKHLLNPKQPRKKMDNYYDSAKNITISANRALIELAKHGVPESEIEEFYQELGKRESYNAQDVLSWLGY
jgi:hypothetical protein